MEVKNLVKSYKNKKVIDDLSFKIQKGKITALIGPNGAGKSTVLKMLARLIERDSGEILIDGKRINEFKNEELAKKIAILSQINEINVKLTVRELISFGRFPHNRHSLNDKDIKKIDQILDYLELKEIEAQYLDELSGGQRQRALIGMVLAQDTEYILLDEPTNNLDIYHITNLMKTIKRLCQELNKTIIIVLHDINYASFYVDYICLLNEGNIVKYDCVEEVIKKEVLEKVYKINFEIKLVNGKPLAIYY